MPNKPHNWPIPPTNDKRSPVPPTLHILYPGCRYYFRTDAGHFIATYQGITPGGDYVLDDVHNVNPDSVPDVGAFLRTGKCTSHKEGPRMALAKQHIQTYTHFPAGDPHPV